MTAMEETHPRYLLRISFAKDMNPVATVNGVGYRKMIKEFEPCYVVPGRKTLQTNFIPKMSKHKRSHINHAIANVSRHTLTTDIFGHLVLCIRIWVSPYVPLMVIFVYLM